MHIYGTYIYFCESYHTHKLLKLKKSNQLLKTQLNVYNLIRVKHIIFLIIYIMIFIGFKE